MSNVKLELAFFLAFLPMQSFPQKQKIREEAFIKNLLHIFLVKRAGPGFM
jgi:hypothetical protein